MSIHFPLWVAWRRSKPGVRRPVVQERDGRVHLVAFDNHGAMLAFNHNQTDVDDFESDHLEKIANINELLAFVNGVSYKSVLINPGACDEMVYSEAHLNEMK